MPNQAQHTFKQRKRWYYQVEACGKTVVEACKIFGISRKTYYKWRKNDFGSKQSYRSKREHPNTKLTSEIKGFIEKQKRRTNYGPLKMQMLVEREYGLRISTTVIYRYYKRKRLIRKPQRRQPWYKPLTERLLILRPGQGVQMDTKYVYGSGVRKYQFSALDPYTRKYYFIIFPTKHSINAVQVFQEAKIYFGFKISSVQTDNGSEYRGDFHNWCTAHDIPHYFIPKSSPVWNSYVERVHRTIDDEYYQNVFRPWKTRYEWLQYYNYERIHLSLNGLTPHEFLTQKCHP